MAAILTRLTRNESCPPRLHGYVAVTIADYEPSATASIHAQHDPGKDRAPRPDEISGLGSAGSDERLPGGADDESVEMVWLGRSPAGSVAEVDSPPATTGRPAG